MSEPSNKLTQREAGIDARTRRDIVAALAEPVAATYTEETLSRHGQFSGKVRIPGTDLVMVGNIGGMGGKFEVAREMHQTFPEQPWFEDLGRNLFNMCCNAILPARPAMFMDYIAAGELDAEVVVPLVTGIATAAREVDCPLVKGETRTVSAYGAEHHAVVGAVVGVVEESRLPHRETIAPGDLLLALPSSGLHSSGFSLFRCAAQQAGYSMTDYIPELKTTLGTAALTVHRLYLEPIQRLIDAVTVKGKALIAANGIPGNLPRVLPDDCSAVIYMNEIRERMPRILRLIQEWGNIEWESDEGGMLETFNLGVGMVVVIEPDQVDAAFAALRGAGLNGYIMGQVVQGEGTVELV